MPSGTGCWQWGSSVPPAVLAPEWQGLRTSPALGSAAFCQVSCAGSQPGAFCSSACFHPFVFTLPFSLTLLPRRVGPTRTFGCPKSCQDPLVPPMATDDCHSSMGDVTFPLSALLISCPHHPTSPSIPRQRDVSGPCQLPPLPIFCQNRTGALRGLFLIFA